MKYRPNEGDLEDLGGDYQTRPKHVYFGVTRDG